MPTRAQGAGNRLEDAWRRFERWRRSCRGYGRIPNELWQVAAEAAAVHGVEATASRLEIDAARLKQWMRSAGDSDAAATPPIRFVELAPLPPDSTAECTLELEDPSGRKLRISLKGAATAHALELGRMLWSGRP